MNLRTRHYAGPMDDIRYGVIGTGMMGVEHIENLAAVDGAVVTAIADTDEGSRNRGLAACSEAGWSPQVYADHQDMLSGDIVDAVVVATPNFTHVDVLSDVLHTDLHVLVEKPLCTSTRDCLTVIAGHEARIASGSNAIVWMGLEYRYMPPVTKLINEVKDGAVGDVKMVGIREHRFPFLEKVGDWNRFSANTGGTWVEKCCHYFDLMNQIVGSRPVRVMSSGGQVNNHLDETYEGRRSDILDSGYAIVEYDNNVRALLDLCMFADATRNQEELSVVGTTGKAEAHIPDYTYRFGQRGIHGIGAVHEEVVIDAAVKVQGFHHGSSYLEHLDFATAMRDGTPPLVTLDDGLWSVAVGEAAHRSIEEDRWVRVDEILPAS